jgi:hypothetical protein
MAGGSVRPADVTVVVCTYSHERRELLDRALDALADQVAPAAEVVVVVDHNDELLMDLWGARPELTIVPNAGERGLSGARNTGVARARSAVVAFLDDDASPEPDWVARLAAAYEPGVLGVGGRIDPVWPDGRRPGWFPAELDWVVGCTYLGVRTSTGPVRNMLGANMSFRTAELRAAGGFRDGLGRIGKRPLGCEETEACLRVSALHPSGEIRYEPQAAVHHVVPAERATWGYVLRRCWAEGLSKAAVARIAGPSRALTTERSYALQTLPRGVARALGAFLRRGSALALGRAAAITLGLAVTTAGFVSGRMRMGQPAPVALPQST